MTLLFDQQHASDIEIAKGVSLLDCKNVIYKSMNLGAFIDYAVALDRIQFGQPLEKSDLELFDHVDKVTSKYLGVTLKDSNVTRARLDACKRYGVEFIDQGGLIDHLNMVEAANQELDQK
jgi:hypothetical protein